MVPPDGGRRVDGCARKAPCRPAVCCPGPTCWACRSCRVHGLTSPRPSTSARFPLLREARTRPRRRRRVRTRSTCVADSRRSGSPMPVEADHSRSKWINFLPKWIAGSRIREHSWMPPELQAFSESPLFCAGTLSVAGSVLRDNGATSRHFRVCSCSTRAGLPAGARWPSRPSRRRWSTTSAGVCGGGVASGDGVRRGDRQEREADVAQGSGTANDEIAHHERRHDRALVSRLRNAFT